MKLFLALLVVLGTLAAPSALSSTVMVGAGEGVYSRPHPLLGTCSVPVAISLSWDAAVGELMMITPTVRACTPFPLIFDGDYLVDEECMGDLLASFSCYSTYYDSWLNVTSAGALTWTRVWSEETISGTVTRTGA